MDGQRDRLRESRKQAGMRAQVKRFKRLRLSASDCDGLSQSPEGTAALTQPFSQRQSSRDSNRGLYPTFRTKKHQRGHQKAITDYFRIKARPSPCADDRPKSRQIKAEDSPGSHSLLGGEWNVAPMTSGIGPCFSQSNSHCEVDNSHGDRDARTLSDSHLDTSPPYRGIKAEDSPESCSLLSGEWNVAPVASGIGSNFSQSNRQCQLDNSQRDQDARTLSDCHLDSSSPYRGIKAEDSPESCSLLSGEWNVAPVACGTGPGFSQSNSQCQLDNSHILSVRAGEESPDQARVKQEVDDMDFDPLPDACFGLLGTTPWIEPQGHVDQLPDEVLGAIFALLPAVDLFQSVSLVCHRWRRITSDPQFVPWKKLYLQYLKRESQAVLTVNAIRHRYGLAKEQNQCMLGLIQCVATVKNRQCRASQALLGCLKSHPLFPVAEICIVKRLPDLESPTEGVPNVWAVMAAIVLFSGSLGDIQKLVACLQRPGSPLGLVEISEVLYCVATLLCAMRDGGVNISNRIHYNIFYCLNQMENPAVVRPEIRSSESGSGCSADSNIQPTYEQQQILKHAIRPGQVVKIVAFAGTGKTSTLIKYAQKWSDLRFLYVAFNKTVAEQGRRAFPRNVTCKTIHSLAYSEVGKFYNKKGKLNFGSLSSYWVSYALDNRPGQSLFIRAKTVVQTLESFLASRDPAITSEHTPIWCKNTHGNRVLVEAAEKEIIIEEANRIWDNMKSLNPTKEMAHRMTHDGYLKLWQLSKPRLSQYDAIFVDEAQDCTPAVMDVVLSQPCGIILVGDPHQQIYTFRGAVNALDEVPHTHLFYLTQSFRFGPEIAYVGASILDICKEVRNKTLVGGIQEGDVTGGEPRRKVAILCRGNQTVFDSAVQVTRGDSPPKIHFIGGLQAFGLSKIRDLWNLLHSELGFEVKDPFLKRWVEEGFQALKNYAERAEDKQLEFRIAIVEKHVSYIPLLLDRISKCHTSDPEAADFVLGTVHKAKGLEFDTVQVADDFVAVPVARHNLGWVPGFHVGKIPADEWNLLYVAVTRAKRQLIMPQFLCHLLTLAGEYYLRPELTSEVCSREPIQCSVRGCSNVISGDSFVTMKRRPFAYSGGAKDPEGYLCHRCVERRLGPLTWLTISPEVMGTLEFAEEIVVLPQDYDIMLPLA